MLRIARLSCNRGAVTYFESRWLELGWGAALPGLRRPFLANAGRAPGADGPAPSSLGPTLGKRRGSPWCVGRNCAAALEPLFLPHPGARYRTVLVRIVGGFGAETLTETEA